jgi:hypothetical protein
MDKDFVNLPIAERAEGIAWVDGSMQFSNEWELLFPLKDLHFAYVVGNNISVTFGELEVNNR